MTLGDVFALHPALNVVVTNGDAGWPPAAKIQRITQPMSMPRTGHPRRIAFPLETEIRITHTHKMYG